MVFDLSGSSKQYLLVERNICETLARQAPDLTVSSCTDHKKYPQQPSIGRSTTKARSSPSLLSGTIWVVSLHHTRFYECFFYAFFNLKKSSFFMTTLHRTYALTQIVASGCFWIRKNVSGVWFPFPFRFEKNSSINKKWYNSYVLDK